MTDSESPLVKALPPETDYITYLTILEYNLTKDELPLLHGLLQDTKLTLNIGWDLVHLLLPLLPDSSQCLNDVARLGDPREVVLKVGEMLEETGPEEEEASEEGEEDEEEDTEKGTEGARKTERDIHPAFRGNGQDELLLSAHRFEVLLNMLSIIHPRIKAKQSRFLAASLEAVIPAYRRLVQSSLATEAIFRLIKSFLAPAMPPLPPRQSGDILVVKQHLREPLQNEEPIDPEEALFERCILLSFCTHVAEIYISSLSPVAGSSSMAWTDRWREMCMPEKTVPHRRIFLSMFREDSRLYLRDENALRLITLVHMSQNPRLNLLLAWLEAGTATWEGVDEGSAEGFSRLPLSRTGLLFLHAATTALSLLLPVAKSSNYISFEVAATRNDFVSWVILIKFICDATEHGMSSFRDLQIIDSACLLGVWYLEKINGKPLMERSVFNQHLQQLSLLSATMPAPNLRYQAHLLASSFLKSNKDATARFEYIKDTMEHCPYENLKTSAVGWLKDEILSAESECIDVKKDTTTQEPKEIQTPLFSIPATLDALFPFLFPSIAATEDPSSILAETPFFLAALNLLYLLRISEQLRMKLEVTRLCEKHAIVETFLQPLSKAAKSFAQQVDGKEPLSAHVEAAPPGGGLVEILMSQVDRALEMSEKT